MFFDFNNQDYEFDSVPQDMLYDINATTGTNLENFNENVTSKIRMLMHIYDDSEDIVSKTVDRLGTELMDNLYFLAVQKNPNIDNDHVMYVDFWFNIVKGYYLNYPFKHDTQRWYYHNERSYVLPEITSAISKTHIYVAPNRVYNDEWRYTQYRKRLVLDLKPYKALGYIGSATINKSWVLWPHGDYPDYTLAQLSTVDRVHKKRWGYAPIHYEYLRDTFISIYGETIEYGNEYFVSEKTYDPLIRGHFILPFSNAGFVAWLRGLGFKFPNFIDYSYDAIIDNDTRYAAYQNEMRRLLNISLDDWCQHWDNNLNILQHNRQIFFERPYDRLDLLKLVEKSS